MTRALLALTALALTAQAAPAFASGLDYSTFLGGTDGDGGYALALDREGNVYVSGVTNSFDFPTTPGAFDPSYNGGPDVFVTKLNAAGSALVYSTFLGGGGSEVGYAIAVDRAGRAHVTGQTSSQDFPTTAGAFDRTFNGGIGDAFAAKLSAAGTRLVYSTYLGSADSDAGHAIAVDRSGKAYVNGFAGAAGFPTTPGAYDTSCNSDAFVTKLAKNGRALVYSTCLGGAQGELGEGVAVDPDGNAYVTGMTASADFPATPGAFDESWNGADDAYVTKLNPSGSALVYSTFLGGTGLEDGFGLALDRVGGAYVTGNTASGDFPTTPGAFDRSYNGGFRDVFVTKVDASGSALAYSTFLGGSSGDLGQAIAVGRDGNAYATGTTASGSFPTTPNAFDRSLSGGGDAFVTRLDVAGSALVYSTFLGGSSVLMDGGEAIAADRAGSAFVTGGTASADFPTTPDAFDPTFNGPDFGGDAFVTKLPTQ
jgi:hypothetical protein